MCVSCNDDSAEEKREHIILREGGGDSIECFVLPFLPASVII